MDAERWKRVDELLQVALQVPAERQEEFLRQQCGGDAALLEEVRSLLTSDRKAGSFLEHPIDLPRLAFTRCLSCGAQNVEPAERCQRCGAALNASPTMSISSEVAPDGHGAADSQRPSQGLGFAPGSMVGDRYRVVSLLGRGGMGEVYGADDLKLGQRVALKFLPAERLKSASWREQFYAEVRMARQVSHPNVCRVYDVGESDGRLFLSMEFVDGEDLASLLRRIGRLPDDKAIEIAQQLCSGLAAAHRSGVLHRDLKPSNVMIDGKGRARITDFGLAIAAVEADRQSGPAGTPGYLAPELFNGSAPSVQSDVYALGLVLYELFTGKRAFEGADLAELHRKQSETNPTPPSNVVKNFDPAIEKAILRCLDRDPSQRPRSALSVAAGLPGGDPLAAALAAGETPAPEVVAAAGPQGSLRPAVAWACLAAALALMLFTSAYLARQSTDWGLTAMNKSPEVLADRAQELAKKLGYPAVVDRASWIDWEQDYDEYIESHSSSKEWRRAWAGHAWPAAVAFWYRQSPSWMTSGSPRNLGFNVTQWDPAYETSGILTVKLDMEGHLLFLRAIPPQVDDGKAATEPDWKLLFDEAGLDSRQFAPASQKWVPPDEFDSRKDWEGHLPGQPDLPIHVTAAGFHGVPVYFQVIAPWDRPWRASEVAFQTRDEIGTAVTVFTIVAYIVICGIIARRHLRSGRGDAKGAMRIAGFVFLVSALAVLNTHFYLRADYVISQLFLITAVLFPAALVWVGYMAIEPFVRRTWPKLLVSWQRLLGGRLRDPLVGRDVLLGGLAGVASGAVIMVMSPLKNNSPLLVDAMFGRGVWPSLGNSFRLSANATLISFLTLAMLSLATRLLRRRWLGLAATGLLLVALDLPRSPLGVVEEIIMAVLTLAVLTRIGLLGVVSFFLVSWAIIGAPPLNFTQWYAGLAVIGLMVPFVLLVYGFYVSLGGQPIWGNALKE